MTNALTQNIENGKDIAIDAMLLSNNSSNNTSSKVSDSSLNFSNIMNTANAKIEKTQSNFVDKAVKSNTSSINKFVLNKKSTKESSDDKKYMTDDRKNLEIKEKVELKKDDKNNLVKEVSLQDKKISKSKDIDAKVTTQEQVSINSQKDNESELKEYDKENLSDINNSSYVESSPVFSHEETKLPNELENIVQNSVNATILPEINLSEIQDFNTKIDEILSNVESKEDLLSAIKEISDLANNSDNLSREFQNEVLNLLQEVKNNIELTENNELVTEFKNILQDLSDKINFFIKSQKEDLEVQKIDVDKIISSENNNEINLETKNSIQELNKKIENVLNEAEKLLSEKIDLDEIKQVVNDIEVNIENISATNNDLNEKVSSIAENIKNLKEILSSNDEKVIVDNNKISNEISAIVQETKEILNEISEANDIQVLKQDNSISNLQKITKIDLEKLSENNVDKKSLAEILDVFKSVDTKDIDDKEIKEEINKIAAEISEKQNEIIENPDKFIQNLVNLKEDVKDYIVKNENTYNQNAVDTAISEVDLKTSKINFADLNLSKDSTNEAYEFTKEEENLLSNQDLNLDIDFEVNEQNIKQTTSKVEKVDINNLEKNLEKAIRTQQLMDEMVIDAKNVTISTQSGALSVADEVAKLAMEEISPLSSNSNLQGSVVYDSASGNGSLIKNAAQLSRMTQAPQNPNLNFSGNDILNQITEKLQQLKGGLEQKLTMVLRPNDLGRLSIELTSNNLGLTTNIMAQNEDVRAYIEKNIDALRQQLSDAGVNVNNIQIKTAGQEGTTNYDGNQNFQNPQDNKDNLNNQNNNNQHNRQNNKQQQQETLASMSNYDLHFAKDFSSILNKSISYSLN